MLVRLFEQHAQRRAAGEPTPTVLVGAAVVRQWIASLSGAVIRLAVSRPDDAVRAYLDFIRGDLTKRLVARVDAVRASSTSLDDKTSFEREVWSDVSRDALLGAGDLDGHLLVGHLLAGVPASSPLRAFAAAARVLAEEAPSVLIDLPPERLDEAVRLAIALAEAAPKLHLAVATSPASWHAWQAVPGRDHARAVVRVCAIEAPSPAVLDDAARSAAERALFEALEADPASRGLFVLNHSLDVRFGQRPLEIDLACSSLQFAIEIDGYFHFQEADAYRRDRRKDVVLQRQGYFVFRVLAEDVTTRLGDIVAAVHESMRFLKERSR